MGFFTVDRVCVGDRIGPKVVSGQLATGRKTAPGRIGVGARGGFPMMVSVCDLDLRRVDI